MALKISLYFLALAVNLATSADNSGLLSRLYKKASSEKRPLILVLDNSLKGSHDRQTRVRASEDIRLNSEPLLQLLQQKPPKERNNNIEAIYDHPITAHKHSDLHRLQDRLEREIRDRKDRLLKKKQEKERAALLSKYSLDRNDRIQHRDVDSLGKFLSDANMGFDRNRGIFGSNDKEQSIRKLEREEKRALRSSVIKSLLRTYNRVNCEAKDDCADECEEENGGSDCDNKCETEFICDPETKETESDGGCTDGSNECEEESREKNISTRGVRLEPEHPTKCARC